MKPKKKMLFISFEFDGRKGHGFMEVEVKEGMNNIILREIARDIRKYASINASPEDIIIKNVVVIQ